MKKIVGVITLCIIVLSGCGLNITITDEQSSIVAEYMAASVLRNGKGYQGFLIIPESKEEQVDPTPTPKVDERENTPQQNDKTKDNDNITDNKPNKNSNINDLIGTNNFSIQYNNYQLYDTYPEDKANTYFSLDPRIGNQFIVVSFLIENVTKEEKNLNLSNAKISYRLDIKADSKYKSLLTLIENDLQYVNVTLKAGEKDEALLIFEVPKNIDMSNMDLIISKDSMTEVIKIK